MNNNNWISISERLPDKSGWYEIKTDIGEYEAPLSLTFSGILIWVIPRPESITHWKHKNVHSQQEIDAWDLVN